MHVHRCFLTQASGQKAWFCDGGCIMGCDSFISLAGDLVFHRCILRDDNWAIPRAGGASEPPRGVLKWSAWTHASPLGKTSGAEPANPPSQQEPRTRREAPLHSCHCGWASSVLRTAIPTEVASAGEWVLRTASRSYKDHSLNRPVKTTLSGPEGHKL